MYIYPENLNIRATIWLWTLKDAAGKRKAGKGISIRKCPYCGCTEFVVGYQNAEGMMMYKKNGLFGNRVRHLICRSCGIILLSKIAEPWKYESAENAWNQ